MTSGHPDEARLAAARPSRLADVISHLLDPVVLVPLGAWLVAARADSRPTYVLLWVSIIVVSYCLVPSVLVLVLLRSGRVADRNMTRREQRMVPLLLAGVSAVTGIAALLGLGAPSPVWVYGVCVVAGLAVTMVATRWSKVSIHTGVAAGFAVQCGWLYGLTGWVAGAAAVVAVAWARWRAGRHSLAQVILGGIVGSVTTALLLRLLL